MKENIIKDYDKILNGSFPYHDIDKLIYPNNKTIIDIDLQEDFEYAEFLLKQDVYNIDRNVIKIGNREITSNELINKKVRP